MIKVILELESGARLHVKSGSEEGYQKLLDAWAEKSQVRFSDCAVDLGQVILIAKVKDGSPGEK